MPELLILGAALCWAVGLVMVRGLTMRVPALQLNATRMLAPGAAFLLFVLATGRLGEIASLPGSNLLAIVVSVVLGVGLGDALLLVAIRRIGVARAFALASTYPLLGALVAVGFLGETLSALALVGAVLIVGGAALLSLEPRAGRMPTTPRPRRFALSLGVLFALLTALLWGVDINVIRIAIDGVDPVIANALRMSLAALALNAAAALRHGRAAPRALGVRGNLLALSAGLVGLTLGSILFLSGLQTLGAARAGALAATSPIFALVLGVLLLRERPGSKAYTGIIMAAVGVALLTFA